MSSELFGFPLLTLVALRKFGIEVDVEKDGTAIGFLILSILAGVLLEGIVCAVLKWSIYRQKQSADDE